jgi:hypothetical protein
LSLNFNNENQYYFTVEIPTSIKLDDVSSLIGVNSDGKEFALDDHLGEVIMDLLSELGHATETFPGDDYSVLLWKVHARQKRRGMAALHTEVSWVKEVNPSAEVSVPAASIAAPDGKVIPVEFSPKAK